MTKATSVQGAIDYATDIVDGKIVACKDVILQCQMFINDYKTNQKKKDFRWEFDEAKADHVLTFIQLLNFIEGSVAGTPIRLTPWQAFLFINAFAWVDKNNPDVRRYTQIICMVGRKNAKSTILAAWALYELQYAPQSSQIYTMATQRDQAKLVWNMTNRLAQASDPRLTKGFKKVYAQISNEENWNIYVPLSKESKRLDGLNARLAIADESAAISDPNLFDVISSSMGSQVSPQFVHITTGQASAQSNPFYALLDYAKRVLSGVTKDERIFTLAYAIDEKDDWEDPAHWIKANPNLGLSVQVEYLESELKLAKEIPSKAANFRTKYLNEFISSNKSWLQVDDWQACAVPTINTTLPLYVGLDLGATSDLTAVSKLFAEDAEFHFDAQAFIPESAFKSCPKHVRSIYDQAASDGSLIVTEGEISDHDAIYDYIIDLAENHDLREVAYDSWSAVHLTSRLQDAGLPMVRFDQSMKSMSPASKEAEVIIKRMQLHHLGSPLFSWCFGNVELFTDVNDNIKLRKGNDPALKIDPIIALVMAIGRATAHGAGKKKPTFQFL